MAQIRCIIFALVLVIGCGRGGPGGRGGPHAKMMASNDLKQIGMALAIHHDQYNRLPAVANYDKDGKPLLSWRVHLLPYLEEDLLYKQFHLDEPWDSDHNKQLIARMPEIYQNPSLSLTDRTVYLAVTGKGTAFPGQTATRYRDILDGVSNTLIVVEADAERAVIWTKPDDFTFNTQEPAAGLGNLRRGGFLCLFADGSTHFMGEDFDDETLRRLMLISDLKPLELPTAR